eukprot:TRINITY_DN19685_c0_g1_i5.p2 TRINITY_DN19685_c0_g1~~TRINITY_DN19685_c0_g1_i5.p2  ORF type:complete len:128 (+),score=13.75 TRINITY_DN19685_c0_g1_i5:141-524(+)
MCIRDRYQRRVHGAMIIYPTLIDEGQFLLSVLGHPIFNPLAKLTYGGYMFHLIFIFLIFGVTLNSYYTSHSVAWYQTFIIYFITYLFSFAATLVYESPVIQALKIYLGGIRRAREDPPTKSITSQFT